MGENLRVLIPIVFLHHVGGVQRQAMLLAKSLRGMGVEVSFLTGRQTGARASDEVDGIPVRRVSFLDGLPLGHVKFHILIRGMVREMLAHSGEYDIIHAHQGLWAAYAGAVAARELDKPLIIKLGNTGERFDFTVLAKSPIFGRSMARYCLRHATRVVATSRQAERELITFGFTSDRIALIPNGVVVPDMNPSQRAEARASLGLDPDDCLILFVGALAPHKRPLLALESFRTVAKESPRARLWFLGDGPMRGRLTQRMEQLEMGGRAQWRGMTTDVATYLRAADIFVLPSAVEGMSNALLEAMAHALPCVATRVSGSEDLIADGVNGLLVTPDDSDALSRAMGRLAADPALRRRLGESARTTVSERCSIDSVAQRYVELYRFIRGRAS